MSFNSNTDKIGKKIGTATATLITLSGKIANPTATLTFFWEQCKFNSNTDKIVNKNGNTTATLINSGNKFEGQQ